MTRAHWLVLALVALAILLGVAPADAQELLLLGGGTRDRSTTEETYGWGLEYAHALGTHAYATLSWLNEGHVKGHHRDGQAAQLWGRTLLLDRRLSLSAGIGPYRYFDTVAAAQGASYQDTHGWGFIYSLAATWYTQDRLIFQLRGNYTDAAGNFDSTSVFLGIGYQLEAPPSRGPVTSPASIAAPDKRHEIGVYGGRSILNSFGSEGVTAWGAEYRYALAPYLDWTVGWIDEGDNHLIRRNGVTSQLWLVRPFFGDRFSVGAGIGPYVAIDRHVASGEEGDRMAALVTFTGSYRFGGRGFVRLSWNRVVTEYSRDSDVILIGGGLRF